MKTQPSKYIGKTTVSEGFPNFRVFENGFLNGPIFTPKWYHKSPKIIQKALLKTNRFSMSTFHQFWMDSGALNHPKTRTGMPPSTPRALVEHLLRTPGANKASRTRFLMVPARFGIDFGRIWAPKWIPKCFQNIQNLPLGFSRFILVLSDLSLPDSSLPCLPLASAGFAKRKQYAGSLPQRG